MFFSVTQKLFTKRQNKQHNSACDSRPILRNSWNLSHYLLKTISLQAFWHRHGHQAPLILMHLVADHNMVSLNICKHKWNFKRIYFMLFLSFSEFDIHTLIKWETPAQTSCKTPILWKKRKSHGHKNNMKVHFHFYLSNFF